MKATMTIILVCIFIDVGIFAQNIHQSISASGGNASGSGGKSSYSVGQTVYTTKTGHNGIVSEGVQQPYEISIVTGKDIYDINLSFSIYPNPATDVLTLSISDNNLANLFFQLTDINGKVIENKEITDLISFINFSPLSKGVYMFSIIQKREQIKTFKIIKN